MNASTRKSVRTVIQVAASCIITLATLVPILGLNTGKYAAVGVVIIALAGLVTKLQTSAESSGKVKTLLDPTKAPSA